MLANAVFANDRRASGVNIPLSPRTPEADGPDGPAGGIFVFLTAS